jgi:metal-dependent amidase/aminoacylase/carboxypeptidase family protein
MSGTTRAFSNEVRKALPVKMERVVKYTGETFRADIKMDYRLGSSPVINDEDSSEIAAGAVKKIMGADALYQYEKTPGGEDFSEYMRLAPGCFAFLGVRNEDLGAVHPQHSCYYTMDESVLINGSMVAAQYVLDFLNK